MQHSWEEVEEAGKLMEVYDRPIRAVDLVDDMIIEYIKERAKHIPIERNRKKRSPNEQI